MQLLSAAPSRNNNNNYRFPFFTNEYVREDVTNARLGSPNVCVN